MTDLDDQLDSADESTISTKCIAGHKFRVPKEKIATSSSGKSFVTLCPKCGKVARLRKDDVYAVFGVNPRDHVAVGNLFASMSGQNTSPTVVPQNEDAFETIARTKPEQVRATVTEDPDDEDEFDDEDDEDDDDVPEEKIYTAQVETASDVTGKKKTVQRFRVLPDEDEDESDDEEDEKIPVERKPVKKVKKPVKKSKPRAVREEIEEEEDEEDEEEDDRRSRRRGSMMDDFEEPADPNDILKEIISESGMDERDMERVFEAIDCTPDGWQPSAIIGVLEMFISHQAAVRLSQKYQGALFIEQKRRDREATLSQMVGTPSGNMRLNNNMPSNTPPFNNPVNRNIPQMGMPFGQPQYPGQAPYGQPQAPYGQSQQIPGYPPQNPQYPPQGAPYPQYDRVAPRPAMDRRSLSPVEIKEMISQELDVKFEKMLTVMTQAKREDALQNEMALMRTQMFDMLREKNNSEGNKPTDPLLQAMLTNQAELNKTLLTNTLTNVNKEDPTMRILIQEIESLKKVNGMTHPSLSQTSDELAQRIQLQKLANELELAQAEFRDKSESRAFTRDLAGQALTKIGESFATAYIESARISAAQPMSAPTPPPTKPVAPTTAKEDGSESENPRETGQNAEVRANDVAQSDDPTKFFVRGTSKEDGSMDIPCPTCGSAIEAKIGDKQVTCSICGSIFNASTNIAPQDHKYAESEPYNGAESQGDSEPEPEPEHPVAEAPKKLKPAKIL